MAELPSDLDATDDTGGEPDRASTTSTAWVLCVPVAIIGLIVLGVVVLHLLAHRLRTRPLRHGAATGPLPALLRVSPIT